MRVEELHGALDDTGHFNRHSKISEVGEGVYQSSVSTNHIRLTEVVELSVHTSPSLLTSITDR